MNIRLYHSANDRIVMDDALFQKTLAALEKRRRFSLPRWIPALACACLLCTLLSLAYLKTFGGMKCADNAAPTENAAGQTAQDSADALPDLETGAAEKSLHFNTVAFPSSPSANRIYLDPEETYAQKLTFDELCEYYGRNPLPGFVPEDLTFSAADTEYTEYSIFYFNNGDIAFDVTPFSYDSADFSRSLHLEVSKGRLPARDYGTPGDPVKSYIDGVEMILGNAVYTYADNSTITVYSAEFLYQGIGYFISSDNLTEKEFLDVLHSITGSLLCGLPKQE
jgi:hypothetical protein